MSMLVNTMMNIMMRKMIWRIKILWNPKLGMRSIMTLIENSFLFQHQNN
jgi:hypothetical protein